jgi:hypothetical protein
MSALDMVKCGIEQLIFKFKGMGYSNIIDKKMLLIQSTPDLSSDGCILASINSEQRAFDHALKNISASAAPHSVAPALDLALRTLAKYRTKSGVENAGMGLVPWALEQAFVIVLTNDMQALVLHAMSLLTWPPRLL